MSVFFLFHRQLIHMVASQFYTSIAFWRLCKSCWALAVSRCEHFHHFRRQSISIEIALIRRFLMKFWIYFWLDTSLKKMLVTVLNFALAFLKVDDCTAQVLETVNCVFIYGKSIYKSKFGSCGGKSTQTHFWGKSSFFGTTICFKAQKLIFCDKKTFS